MKTVLRNRCFRFGILPFLVVLLMLPGTADAQQPGLEPSPDELRFLMNLHAFTRLFGFVRYFHPSDEAAELDWNRFAIHGAGTVMSAPNQAELQKRLEELFLPLAPSLSLRVGSFEPLPLSPPPASPVVFRRLFWQHQGLGNGAVVENPFFRSVRTTRDNALFEVFPDCEKPLVQELANDLYAAIPLCLWADPAGTLPRADPARLAALRAAVAAVPAWDASRLEHRLAPAIVLWTLLQHFHPFFPELSLSWDRHLIGSFRGLREAQDLAGVEQALYDHLLVLTADSHARLRHPDLVRDLAWPNMAVLWANGEVVVAGSEIEGLLPGDLLKEVDGRRFSLVQDDVIRRLAGSAQYRQAASLETFGIGPAETEARLAIERDWEPAKVVAKRTAKERVLPFRRGLIEELPGGGFYVDLRQPWGDRLEAEMEGLAAGPRLVVDVRGEVGPEAHNFLSHLIPSRQLLPRWEMAQTVMPELEAATWEAIPGREVLPALPRLAGKVAFLVDGSTRGAAEDLLQVVQNLGLGEIVGSCSGGGGGRTSVFTLPGGFEIELTLTRLRRPSDDTFFLQGVCPQEDGGGEIEPSAAGLQSGRDELLERAIERMSS